MKGETRPPEPFPFNPADWPPRCTHCGRVAWRGSRMYDDETGEFLGIQWCTNCAKTAGN